METYIATGRLMDELSQAGVVLHNRYNPQECVLVVDYSARLIRLRDHWYSDEHTRIGGNECRSKELAPCKRLMLSGFRA
jgi:hypothetical protein